MNSKEFEQHVQNSYFLKQLFAELQAGYAEALLKTLDVLAEATDPRIVRQAIQKAIVAPPATGQDVPFARELLRSSLQRLDRKIGETMQPEH